MPGRKKCRKFIDPKVDVVHRFKVISRSQQDPLTADENAPQGVLCPDTLESGTNEALATEYSIYFDDDYDYLQHLRGVKESIDWENCDLEVYNIRKKDAEKGKHNASSGLVLPSSAFQSYIEEPIGLLNRAAPVTGPQPDLDPDLVAEMDRMSDDSNYIDSTDMPDDFIDMLNSDKPLEADQFHNEDTYDAYIHNWLGHTGMEEYNEMPPLETSDDEYADIDQKGRILGTVYEDENSVSAESIDHEFNVSDEDENEEQDRIDKSSYIINGDKSNIGQQQHGSSYDPLGYGGNYDKYENDEAPFRKRTNCNSMTSRVSHSSSYLPRTEVMSQLNDRVQYVLEHEYSENQWGALDGEEICGGVDLDSDLFKQVFDATKIELEAEKYLTCGSTIKWIKDSVEVDDVNEKDRAHYVRIPRPVKEKFNCETIIAARAKYINQPTIIDYKTGEAMKIVIDNKRGYPIIQNKSSLTRKDMAKHDKAEKRESDSDEEVDAQTIKSMLSVLSIRPKGESALDRRERKSTLKELRRERRIEKKISRDAFKEEKKTQIRNDLNMRRNRWQAVV